MSVSIGKKWEKIEEKWGKMRKNGMGEKVINSKFKIEMKKKNVLSSDPINRIILSRPVGCRILYQK
jgi:hypothetical protein